MVHEAYSEHVFMLSFKGAYSHRKILKNTCSYVARQFKPKIDHSKEIVNY